MKKKVKIILVPGGYIKTECLVGFYLTASNYKETKVCITIEEIGGKGVREWIKK